MSDSSAPAARATTASVRERYTAFVNRHEVAWELSFAALAVVFVAMAFVPVVPQSPEEAALESLEYLITGVFIVEFGSRLWAAPSRRQYLRGHWIDVISCIPPVRWLRPFRLLRLLRLVRAFAGVGRALTHVQRLANHRGLVWLFVAWLAVMLLCSVALFAAENGINKAVESPLDALWWGITTMTTVGYGDVYPVTAEGRIAATILMVLGIGLYSAITATLTSFMLTGSRTSDLTAQLERLSTLHATGQLSNREYEVAKATILGSEDLVAG